MVEEDFGEPVQLFISSHSNASNEKMNISEDSCGVSSTIAETVCMATSSSQHSIQSKKCKTKAISEVCEEPLTKRVKFDRSLFSSYQFKLSDKMETTSSASTAASSDISENSASPSFKSPPSQKLLVWNKHREILESVNRNQVTVIIGEPGSGKTTQVPQMLLADSPHSTIAVTQPRRVAAITLATRVLEELKANRATSSVNQQLEKNYTRGDRSDAQAAEESDNDALYTLGGIVGYSVRFQHKASRQTRIKFLTDGCLLREAMSDRLLKRFRIIIIDEAHERTARTDILLGLLKSLLAKRPKLRLIIMSATLNYKAFTQFFGSGNVILVQGRQHPVAIHNAISPCSDYLVAMMNVILQLHLSKRLGGDILAFLPGQEEIESVRASLEAKRESLRAAYGDYACFVSIIQSLRSFRQRQSWEEFVAGNWEKPGASEATTTTELLDYVNSISPGQVKCLKELRECIARGFSLPMNANENQFHSESDRTNQIRIRSVSDISQIVFNCRTGIIGEGGEDSFFLSTQKSPTLTAAEFIVLPMYAALPREKQDRVFEPSCPGTRKIILATNIAETSLTIPGVKYVIDSGFHKIKLFNPLSSVESLAIKQISRAMANQRTGRAGREGSGESYRLFTEQEYFKMDVQIEPEIKRCNLAQVVLELKAIGVNNVATFPFLDAPSSSALSGAIALLTRLDALDSSENLTNLGSKLAAIPVAPEHARFLLESFAFECTSEVLTLVAVLNTDAVWVGNSRKRREQQSSEETIARKRVMCVYGDHLTLINAYCTWDAVHSDKLGFCKSAGLNHKSLLKAKQIRNQLKASRLPVSIHPSSGLFGRCNKPQFVVFSELVQTTKLYMRTVTAVESDWLLQLLPRMFLSSSMEKHHVPTTLSTNSARQKEFKNAKNGAELLK